MNNKIKSALDSISVSEQAKQKMYQNILQKSTSDAQAISKKPAIRQALPFAACIAVTALAVGSSVLLWPNHQPPKQETAVTDPSSKEDPDSSHEDTLDWEDAPVTTQTVQEDDTKNNQDSNGKKNPDVQNQHGTAGSSMETPDSGTNNSASPSETNPAKHPSSETGETSSPDNSTSDAGSSVQETKPQTPAEHSQEHKPPKKPADNSSTENQTPEDSSDNPFTESQTPEDSSDNLPPESLTPQDPDETLSIETPSPENPGESFPESEPPVMVGSPVSSCSIEDINALGIFLSTPENASNLSCYLWNGTIGEVDFSYDGHDYFYRASKEDNDFSGIFGTISETFEISSGCPVTLEKTTDGIWKASWTNGIVRYYLGNSDGSDISELVDLIDQLTKSV